MVMFRSCKFCGRQFFKVHNAEKYCSEQCSKNYRKFKASLRTLKKRKKEAENDR